MPLDSRLGNEDGKTRHTGGVCPSNYCSLAYALKRVKELTRGVRSVQLWQNDECSSHVLNGTLTAYCMEESLK
jgi:hypothetical protein